MDPTGDSTSQPQADGQPATSAPAQGEQSGNGVTYVTKEEVTRMLTDLERRQKQSLKDVVSNRVIQEMQRLQAAGISATPEQVAQLVAKQEEAGKQETGKPSPAEAAPASPAQGGSQSQAPQDPIESQVRSWMREDGIQETQANPLLMEVYRIQAREGTRLTDDDPEAKEIKTEGTMLDILLSVREAVLKKKARVGKEGSPARLPSLSGGAPGAPARIHQKAIDIFDEYYKKKGKV